MSVTTHCLRNNIDLITEPIDKLNTASVGFWFSTGSRFEKDGQHGITHFIEHLIFKGTSKRSARDISCSFDRIGGYINAFTERDAVCLTCTIPYSKDNFKLAVDILCDMSTNAIFPEDEVEKERLVVENEIQSVNDDAEELSLDVLASCIWPNQGLSQSITGTLKDVQNLKIEEIKKWYKEQFVSGELTVFAVGKIDEEVLINSLEELPLHKKRKPRIERIKNIEKIDMSFSKNVKKSKFLQSQIYLTYNLPIPQTHKENFIIQIFNSLYGESLSSRLFDSLREKTGLCYSVCSFYTYYEDVAIFSSYASCHKSNSFKVTKILFEQIQKLFTEEISQEEINIAKEHLCGEEIMNDLDPEFVMKRLQRFYYLNLPLLSTNEIINGILAIEKNDIIEFTKKCFFDKESALLIFGHSLSLKEKKEILCHKK